MSEWSPDSEREILTAEELQALLGARWLELRRKFLSHCKGLEDLLAEIRRTQPEANLYLQEDTMHLMSGPSHEGRGEKYQQRSMASRRISGADGGGW